MLFNSHEFIFLFLPFIVLVYFFLNQCKLTLISSCWLILASLLFYSYWNIIYLPLLLASILINFGIGNLLLKKRLKLNRRVTLVTGIIFNVALLMWFKHYDFFVTNINYALSTNFTLLNLLLPLGISFFTFQQISYLVDTYRNETKDNGFIYYMLFVSFFPQLIAGPIVQHKEMVPQFIDNGNRKINYKNIAVGIFIFTIGLFKKVGIADTLAVWANAGFDQFDNLTMFEGWIASLSFTFQLYFDFSGYTDMAIGSALLFNIKLPMNFNSPYKSLNLIEFWRRWHITLSRFLFQYIYVPLGGSRNRKSRTYVNLLIIFLISGFWHGSGWTFIFWGILHGFGIVINRIWRSFNIKINKIIAWFITFNFVNVSWIFFRANNWGDALKIFKSMFGFNGINMAEKQGLLFVTQNNFLFILITLALSFIVIFCKNSFELSNQFIPSWRTSIAVSILAIYSIFSLTKVSVFLYFNF